MTAASPCGTLDNPANLSGLFLPVLWIRFGFTTRIRIQLFRSMRIRIRIQYGTPGSPPNLSGLSFPVSISVVDPPHWFLTRIRIQYFRSCRIRIRILGLISVAYPHPGSTAFLCFLCFDVGKVLVPVWNPDSFPRTKNLYINFYVRCIIIFPFGLPFLNFWLLYYIYVGSGSKSGSGSYGSGSTTLQQGQPLSSLAVLIQCDFRLFLAGAATTPTGSGRSGTTAFMISWSSQPAQTQGSFFYPRWIIYIVQ